MRTPILVAALVLLSGTAAFGASPDWVSGGGTSPRFPHRYFLTGYGLAEIRDGKTEDALRVAKNDAAAAVASAVRVRIEQTLTSVQSSNPSGSHADVSAVTRAAAEAQVAGLVFETAVEAGRAHALAVLERLPAAADHRRERDRLVTEARKRIADGVDAETRMRTADATRLYYAARMLLLSAEGEDSLALAIADDHVAAAPEAGELRRNVENRIESLFKGGQGSLEDAIAMLALQLRQQGIGREATLKITPLQDGATTFSSPLGRAIANGLEASLARSDAETQSGIPPIRGALSITGSYEDGDEVRMTVFAREESSGRALASAAASVPATVLPVSLGRHAANANVARTDTSVLAAAPEAGTLRLELWTQKGRGPLTLSRGEQVQLFMKVNRPAWVRLTYLLANGQKAVLAQSFHIDASQVNKPVRYPSTFTVTPPFGVEQLFGVAYAQEPAPLKTTRLTVEEGAYDVVESVQSLVVHRGLSVTPGSGAPPETSEALLTMTTLGE